MKLFKKYSSFIILIALLSVTLRCTKEDNDVSPPPPPSNALNKIMPLGASRVAGDRPAYESYRYELWKLLVDGSYEFDFLGTEMDNASYPDFNGLSFDRDHEGRGGISSGEILEEINIWLNDLGSKPDIVLFSSPGGNDAIDDYDQTKANIVGIINALQAFNPNVTIYLELPAPPLTSSQTEEFLDFYNQALQDLPILAQEQNTTTSRVLTIDMRTGFEDSFLADDVHYSKAGAVFIANKYFDELQNILQ